MRIAVGNTCDRYFVGDSSGHDGREMAGSFARA